MILRLLCIWLVFIHCCKSVFYTSHVHLYSLITVSVRNVSQYNSPHIVYLNFAKPRRRLSWNEQLLNFMARDISLEGQLQGEEKHTAAFTNLPVVIITCIKRVLSTSQLWKLLWFVLFVHGQTGKKKHYFQGFCVLFLHVFLVLFHLFLYSQVYPNTCEDAYTIPEGKFDIIVVLPLHLFVSPFRFISFSIQTLFSNIWQELDDYLAFA
jgi:hypothetical protein